VAAQIGARAIEMVIKELRLERAIKLGKDPLEMARRLFTHYRRGLYIDTGVGEEDSNLTNAEDFCDKLNLRLEKCSAKPYLLKEWFARCKQIGKQQLIPVSDQKCTQGGED
jgi:Protein of unknown function (DUF1638)